MSNKRTSRRQFLHRVGIAAGLAAAPLARRGFAQAKRQVTMRLDWLYQGPNAGFLIAQDKGFYEQAGLNVEIGPGKGSGSTAQLVASKATQFGFADGFVVGNSVSKGMSIKMVAGIFRRNPTAVVVLDDSDIKTPKDLEGRTIGGPTGGTQFVQWPAFVKGCGLDGSKIRFTNIDPAGSPPALITGQVAAIAGYAQGLVPSVEIRGNKKARVLWYADCGVTAVNSLSSSRNSPKRRCRRSRDGRRSCRSRPGSRPTPPASRSDGCRRRIGKRRSWCSNNMVESQARSKLSNSTPTSSCPQAMNSFRRKRLNSVDGGARVGGFRRVVVDIGAEGFAGPCLAAGGRCPE